MAYPIESILTNRCPIIPLMSQILDNALVSLPYVALTYAKVLSHLCSTYWLRMTFIDKYVESHSLKEKHRYQFYSVNKIYEAVTNL